MISKNKLELVSLHGVWLAFSLIKSLPCVNDAWRRHKYLLKKHLFTKYKPCASG